MSLEFLLSLTEQIKKGLQELPPEELLELSRRIENLSDEIINVYDQKHQAAVVDRNWETPQHPLEPGRIVLVGEKGFYYHMQGTITQRTQGIHNNQVIYNYRVNAYVEKWKETHTIILTPLGVEGVLPLQGETRCSE